MFLRLWHPRVICCYDKNGEVDRPNPSDHIVHEVGMSGNVNYSDLKSIALRVRNGQRKMGKAKLDRYPAFLFLGKAVRVSARQSLHESRFPMINMTGGPDDEITRHEF